MSWLSGLAGRAESFLNQMDQVAATSLQEAGIGTPSPNKPSVANQDDVPVTTGLRYEPVAQPVLKPALSQTSSESKFTKSFIRQPDNKPTATDSSVPQHSRPHSSTSMRSLPDNDNLMSFLNSPITKSKNGARHAKTTPSRPRSSQEREKKETKDQWNMESGWNAVDNSTINRTEKAVSNLGLNEENTQHVDYHSPTASPQPHPPVAITLDFNDTDLSYTNDPNTLSQYSNVDSIVNAHPDTHTHHGPDTHTHDTDTHTHEPDTHTHEPDTHTHHDPDTHTHRDPDTRTHPDTHTHDPDTHTHHDLDTHTLLHPSPDTKTLSYSNSDTHTSNSDAHTASPNSHTPDTRTLSHSDVANNADNSVLYFHSNKPDSHTSLDFHTDCDAHSISNPNHNNSPQSIPNLPLSNHDPYNVPNSQNDSFSNPHSYSYSESDSTTGQGLPSPVIAQPGGKPQQLATFIEEQKLASITRTGSDESERLSNLELENQLLRQEIQSLSEELGSARAKSKETHLIESQYREEIKTLREQCTRLDSHLRHMRSQEDDLTTALEARDSQIHILRVRLEESDQLITSLKLKSEEAEKERERLIHDVGLSSSAQNQALESVNAHLQQIQALLASEKKVTASLQNEVSEREIQFANEKTQLSEALRVQQIETQSIKFQYSESQRSHQKVLFETQQLRKEFEEYKLKATSVLQNKERLIATLQSSNGGQLPTHDLALEEIRSEKQQLLSQLHVAQEQMATLKEELQNMEDQHVIEIEQMAQQLNLIDESLDNEKRSHSSTKEDLNRMKEELEKVRNDFVREKGMLAAQIREKDNEVLVMSSRIATIGTEQLDSSRKDLEGRLQELTESLIQKQTTLEMLSSEKNSLYVQLEKTKAALKNAESTNTIRQTALDMGDGGRQGQASTPLHPMNSILPSSNDGVTQGGRHMYRVRNTLDHMDRIGLHVGWVLKRYPWIRLLLFVYILMLHLWVTFVLLTYKPEMHVDGTHDDNIL